MQGWEEAASSFAVRGWLARLYTQLAASAAVAPAPDQQARLRMPWLLPPAPAPLPCHPIPSRSHPSLPRPPPAAGPPSEAGQLVRRAAGGAGGQLGRRAGRGQRVAARAGAQPGVALPCWLCPHPRRHLLLRASVTSLVGMHYRQLVSDGVRRKRWHWAPNEKRGTWRGRGDFCSVGKTKTDQNRHRGRAGGEAASSFRAADAFGGVY